MVIRSSINDTFSFNSCLSQYDSMTKIYDFTVLRHQSIKTNEKMKQFWCGNDALILREQNYNINVFSFFPVKMKFPVTRAKYYHSK